MRLSSNTKDLLMEFKKYNEMQIIEGEYSVEYDESLFSFHFNKCQDEKYKNMKPFVKNINIKSLEELINKYLVAHIHMGYYVLTMQGYKLDL